MGRRALLALAEQVEMKDVRTLIGAVEPENTASRSCLVGASFMIAQEPNEEGMLPVEKKLRP